VLLLHPAQDDGSQLNAAGSAALIIIASFSEHPIADRKMVAGVVKRLAK
jgi:hypothetical protein